MMPKTPPNHIAHLWRLYNCLEELMTCLWDIYGFDFLEHYFPEVTGLPHEPPTPPQLAVLEDEIPF